MRTIEEVEAEMGITLMPWQRQYFEIWERDGEPPIMVVGRQTGRKTLQEFARRMMHEDA